MPELLREVGAWAQRAFPNESVQGKLEHLQEEVNELRENTNDKEEWADCFLLLFDAARKNGYTFDDIANLILRKYQKNLKRSWKEDSAGVYHHFEEAA